MNIGESSTKIQYEASTASLAPSSKLVTRNKAASRQVLINSQLDIYSPENPVNKYFSQNMPPSSKDQLVPESMSKRQLKPDLPVKPNLVSQGRLKRVTTQNKNQQSKSSPKKANKSRSTLDSHISKDKLSKRNQKFAGSSRSNTSAKRSKKQPKKKPISQTQLPTVRNMSQSVKELPEECYLELKPNSQADSVKKQDHIYLALQTLEEPLKQEHHSSAVDQAGLNMKANSDAVPSQTSQDKGRPTCAHAIVFY